MDQLTVREIEKIVIGLTNTFKFMNRSVSVEEIQDAVERRLMLSRSPEVARKYIRYRYDREKARKGNTTDDTVLTLIECDNEEIKQENSNKNSTIIPTQRDYIAGEVNKDLTRRKLLSEKIVNAHDKGIIHFHDADYFIQPIFNCCLINIGDMLDNGTVMNGKMIESPKSFQVACTVMTQIIASVASSQYGGQSVDIRHLGKYLRRSYDKFKKSILEAADGNMRNIIIFAALEAVMLIKHINQLREGRRYINALIIFNALQTLTQNLFYNHSVFLQIRIILLQVQKQGNKRRLTIGGH